MNCKETIQEFAKPEYVLPMYCGQIHGEHGTLEMFPGKRLIKQHFLHIEIDDILAGTLCHFATD